MKLSNTQHGTQHGNSVAGIHMMGDLMIPDERVLSALHNSRLVENLRDFEINVLASLITIQYFEISEFNAELDDDSLQDALLILVEGDIELSAFVGNEPVSLHLEVPRDLARISSFERGNLMNVSARIK